MTPVLVQGCKGISRDQEKERQQNTNKKPWTLDSEVASTIMQMHAD